MASISPVHRHSSEQTVALIAFGAATPDFFTIKLESDHDHFSLSRRTRIARATIARRIKKPKVKQHKLLSTAKRFAAKLGRKARVHMLQLRKH